MALPRACTSAPPTRRASTRCSCSAPISGCSPDRALLCLKPFVALPREPGTLGLETAIVYCETGIAVPRLVDPKGSRHRSLWHRLTLRRALRTALVVGRLDPL